MNSWLAVVFFFAALVFALIRAPEVKPTAFAASAFGPQSTLPSEFALELLPPVASSAHASSLTALADGRLAAAWYAGTREGATDVRIWLSTRDANGWSAPRAIVTRDGVSAETGAGIRKLGNPVIWSAGASLHLWYVGVSIGGWSGSSIHHAVSADEGRSWSKSEKLVTSPFFNVGTLVRAQPLAMMDGGIGLPVYHELFARRAEWLRMDRSGRILGKARMNSSAGLQPSVAAIDADRGIAVLRSADRQNGRVMLSLTDDGGASWRQSAPLPLTNRNSAVALLRLASGRLLLACNPDRGRNLLQLFISDDGRTWLPARTVASDPDPAMEYSYPALLQTRDGRIHLTFTFRRQTIAHAVFTEAALTESRP